MKKLLYIGILFLITLTSCEKPEEVPPVTLEARQEIANLYGCRVFINIKPNARTINGKKTHLEVLLREGKALDYPAVSYVGSNASLIAYLGMSKVERDKHTHIQCVIEDEEETESFKSYISSLQNMENLLPQVNQMDSILRSGKYEDLNELMTPFAKEKLGEELISQLKAEEEEKGKVTEIQSLGYKLGKSKLDGKSFMAASWMFLVKRVDKNTSLELVLPVNAEEKRILGIRIP
ncbi:MAG: hypothetical protein AAF740_07985 [Bacteroidota bacterium]